MTRYRDLGVTAPYDTPGGAAVQIDRMPYVTGADIHAGDHLAVDTQTGCIVPRPPLGDSSAAPDPLDMGTIVNSEPRGYSAAAVRDAMESPRGLDALIPTTRCPEQVERGGGVQCDRYVGHEGGHGWGTGPFTEGNPTTPHETIRAAVVAAEDERLLREPETVAAALEDVHRRYCAPESALSASYQAHDPVCRILSAALAKPLKAPVGPKLGGQRQGGARTATEAAELVLPKAGTQRAKVLAALRREWFVKRYHGLKGGLTDVELASLTGLPANSVRPRRVELVDAGWVHASEHVRVHNGRKHVVWTLTPAGREIHP